MELSVFSKLSYAGAKISPESSRQTAVFCGSVCDVRQAGWVLSKLALVWIVGGVQMTYIGHLPRYELMFAPSRCAICCFE